MNYMINKKLRKYAIYENLLLKYILNNNFLSILIY